MRELDFSGFKELLKVRNSDAQDQLSMKRDTYRRSSIGPMHRPPLKQQERLGTREGKGTKLVFKEQNIENRFDRSVQTYCSVHFERV